MERILSDLELAAEWAAYNQFVKSHVTEQQSTAELEWAHWEPETVVGSSSNPINWHDLEKRCISKKIDKLGRHPGLPTFFSSKFSTKQMVWVVSNMGDLNNVAQTAEDINGGQEIEYLESASLGQGFIFRLTEWKGNGSNSTTYQFFGISNLYRQPIHHVEVLSKWGAIIDTPGTYF